MKALSLLLLIYFTFSPYSYSQTINTVAGNGTPAYSGDGGPATSASLSRPISCVMDNAGNLLISDFTNSRIRKVSPAGIITTIAGNGTPGFGGDGGPATAAIIQNPEKITVDGAGNIYFCDFYNQRIRKIDVSGIITTIAGTGAIGYTGDGGPATAATFWDPAGIALDAAGNIYICDEWNNRIRKINTAGIITTIAGNGPTGFMAGGYGGDGGPALSAQINFPVGIGITAGGSIVFSDDGNQRIREISPAGVITTIAGNGTAGSIGDGGPATAAEVNSPEGLTVDPPTGNVYICETGGNKVRKINAAGIISTIAGTGISGFSGDGGLATAAKLQAPEGVYVDPGSSCIYICDSYNNRVRLVGTCIAVAATCDSISMADTLHLCMGDTATIPAVLSGTDSVSSITWTPAAGLSDTTILDPVLTASAPGWYYLTVNSILPDNLVVNGDFSAGNTGFSSGYTLEGYGTTSIPGHFAVDTDPNLYDGAWPAMGDHTTGTGNMLIVDGSYTASDNFWCETLPVTANTNYIFTVWAALLHVPQPVVQITINGAVVNTFTVSATSAAWYKYQVNWNSGTATSASICMNDLMTGGFGNDFAVDDISFEPICTVKDSIYLGIHTTDTLHTHTDTTVCALAGSIVLNAPAGYISPTWNTGATAASITASDSGTYWVTAINGCSLMADTISVIYTAPGITAIKTDTILCPGNSIILTAPASYTSHQWSTGDTTSSIPVTDSGKYWVEAVSGCSFLVDTFSVSFISPDANTIKTDTSFCVGSTLILTAPASYISHVWSNGDTASSINVTTQGTQWVASTNLVTCTISTDTFIITAIPLPVVSLTDTVLCIGDSIVLSSPGTTGSYLWSTGSTNSAITVFSGGNYVLTVKNNGCSGVDTSSIVQLTAPSPVNLGPDTIMCIGDVYVLSSGTDTVTWSTGVTGTSISVTEAGIYAADVNNICGSATDSITVSFELCDIAFPNAFTPNNDGKNDVAHVLGSLALFKDYSLNIYNRFGELVFYTEDIYSGWDGTYKGVNAELGTYFYMIHYTLEGKQHMLKGDLALIR